ncbi:MAG: hypothetical protein JWL91_2322, partial [Sphingomonas bacterium]|nr:hypothetical protein [Sphingomonas bacterium]
LAAPLPAARVEAAIAPAAEQQPVLPPGR